MRLTLRFALMLKGLAVMLLLGAFPASAQLLHLDPLPFPTPADSTSRLALEVQVDRFEDSKFNWSGHRLLVSVQLPAGESASFFVRMPYMTFDNGGLELFSRWPWLEHPTGEIEWPAVQRRSSLGQPEIGATRPSVLPLLGRWDVAAALGIPAGSDFIYPFSSTSIPLRLEGRRLRRLGERGFLALNLGYLKNMGSGKELLEGSEAFTDGFHVGARAGLWRGRGSRWILVYDYHRRSGRVSQTVGFDLWGPWTDDGSVGLKVRRELQGSLVRSHEWQVGIAFRFDSAKYRPGAVIQD